MPLRPALAAFHPKGPKPKAVRQVNCPHCSAAFDISQKAMSVRCPRCTRPLAFEDLHLDSKVQGDVSTMGAVRLGEQGEMVGRLICGTLTNAGRVDGKVVVYGRAELQPHSLTTGTLNARSVLAHRGAAVRMSVKIGPKPLVATITAAVTTRPVQRAGRRIVGGMTNAERFKPVH
ncbi:MAG: polymer-forming cytoskeletal protein [Phycisphaeraceae bacterium]